MEERGFSGVYFTRTLILFMRDITSHLITSLKASPPNSMTLEIKFQQINWVKGSKNLVYDKLLVLFSFSLNSKLH